MATLTARKPEASTPEEKPKEHKLLTSIKEWARSLMTQLSGPPTTKSNRRADQLFADRLDRWYPRA